MKKSVFDNFKFAADSLYFHGKRFLKDVKDFCSPIISSANDVKKLLEATATVNDLLAIESALRGVYNFNGKLCKVMDSSQYKRYDDSISLSEIIYFNADGNTKLTDEDLSRAFKILESVSNLYGKHLVSYCIFNRGKLQFYFLINEGKNGCGDFVDDDMKNIVEYLDAMKKAGATWRTVTDMLNDVPDDVSSWVLTFTID